VLTMFDRRNRLSDLVASDARSHFGDWVYETVIPRNIRLGEAPSHGQPIHLYDRSSRGAIAYIGLAGEIIRRERGLPPAANVDAEADVEAVEPPAPSKNGPTLKAPAANQQD